MWTASKFLAGVVSTAGASEPARTPSSSRGAVLAMRGSTAPFDALGVTLLLRASGVSLSSAYLASNALTYCKTVNVRLAVNVDVAQVKANLRRLGAIVDD